MAVALEILNNYGASIALAFLSFVLIFAILRRRSRLPNLPPGPPAWPIFGNMPDLLFAKCEPQYIFEQWAKQYGKIMTVRIGGQTAVCMNDFDLMKEAYQQNTFNGRPQLCAFETAFGRGSGIGTGDGKFWQEQRRLASSVFRNLRAGDLTMEEVVVREAGKLLAEFEEFKGQPFDITHILPKAVCNIVCAFTFGSPFEYTDETYIRMLRLVYQNFKLAGPSAVVYSSAFLAKLPFGPGKTLVDNLKEFYKFVQDIIQDHRESFDKNHIRDFVDSYFVKIDSATSSEEAEIFTRQNLFWCINDLFGAGTETTAGTLRWAFVYLVKYPDVQERMQKELDEVVGRGRMPVYSDRMKLPYVQAVIQEINRHADIGPMGVAHAAVEDATLLGYDIPKGTLTMANAHFVHFNPERFPDPLKFKPERFISEEGNFIKRDDVIAFSLGKRTCPGEELASIELFIFITHALHRFQVVLPQGATPPTLAGYTSITRVPYPFEIQMTER